MRKLTCSHPLTKTKVSSVAYIDTLEMFCRHPPSDVVERLQRLCGRAWPKPCNDRHGHFCGWRIIANQPREDALRLLQAIKDHHKGVLCRLDVSVDYLTSDPDQLFALAEDVRRCALLRWRPKGWMSDEGGTTRWVYFAGRRRPNRNFLLYADRPSKTGGTANVLHLELRFLRAAVIRRGGYEDPASLIGLDPSVPFSTNIKLVDFDPLPRLSKKVRKTVQYYRRDPASEFSENYYETIPDRVEKLWARLDMHRAQGYQNIFRDAFSGTPGFSLPVPEKLTFFTPSG